MENASKALIIAGAILLSIAIIGIGMFVYQSVSGTIQDAADMSEQEISAYNQDFTTYEGSARGSAAKSLCQVVRNHNLNAADDSEKVAIYLDQATEDPFEAGSDLTATTTTAINDVRNALQSGKTYDVTFGFDPSTGLVTAVFINEAEAGSGTGTGTGA